jgi:hypothetical protein
MRWQTMCHFRLSAVDSYSFVSAFDPSMLFTSNHLQYFGVRVKTAAITMHLHYAEIRKRRGRKCAFRTCKREGLIAYGQRPP